MNEQDARNAVLAAIGEVAPDVEASDLDPRSRLRQDLELDSLDFLRLVQLLANRTGVEAPEEDYPSLTTVQAVVDYIAARG
ncbi:phosphopantetheine-binding protein [Microbacterium thalassium]|uniref:phosphopantetheine-binding protein n=1 Tax=Microbacterium TaxID=33882 RepID=UPI00146C867E|nr:phosphopantetheine-binding protein [Microbacterium thalassium]